MNYELESYYARAGGELKEKPPAAAATPFTIEVRFLGGLTQTQKDAFKTAADRWTRVIVGDLPPFEVNGEIIDDILIEAQGQNIDGPGGILGQAGRSRVKHPRLQIARLLVLRNVARVEIDRIAAFVGEHAGECNGLGPRPPQRLA